MSATDTYGTLVQQFYVAYFGRPADPAAVPNFAAALAAAHAPATLADLTSAYYTSDTIRALIDSFGTSHESAALYGAVSNDAADAANFVGAIFANLFNRAPATAGLSYWVAALLDGSMSPGNAALTIAAAAAANTTTQGMLDAHAVANKTAVAALFTADLSNPAYVAAYAGAAAAAAARTLLAGVDASTLATDYASTIQQTADSIANLHPVVLTVNADTLMSGSFNGLLSSTVGASTLNAGDVLHGSGNAVLNIASDGASFPGGLTMDHVQTINITAAAPMNSVNVSGYSDVKALKLSAANLPGNGYSVVTAGAATAVSYAITTTASSNTAVFHSMDVLGGSDVTLNSLFTTGECDASGGTLFIGDNSNAHAATGAVTINEAINVTGLAGHTIHGSPVPVQDAGSSVTINETVATAAGTTGISTVYEGGAYIIGSTSTTAVTVNQAAASAGSTGLTGTAHVIDGDVSIQDANTRLNNLPNSITTVTLSNFSHAEIDDNALKSLTLAGTDGAISIVNLTNTYNATLLLALHNAQVGVLTDNYDEIRTLAINTGAGDSSLAGITDDYLATLDLSGAGNLHIGTLVDGHNSNNLHSPVNVVLTNSGTGADSIDNWDDGVNLASLTVRGNIALGDANDSDPAISLSSADNFTFAAASDNARMHVKLSGAGIGSTDTITAGNGNNHIIDTSVDGTVNVTVGSGANVIDLSAAVGASYSAHVTLGAHAAASDTVIVGTGVAGAIAAAVVISGAVSGDHLVFDDAVSAFIPALLAAQQTVVNGEATLAGAVAYVDSLASTIVHSATAFQYGADTYVLESANAGNGTLTAYDSLVELAGLHSASGMVFGGIAALNVTLDAGTAAYTGGVASDHFTGTYSDNDSGNTLQPLDFIDGQGGINTLTINPATANTSTTLLDGDLRLSHIQNLAFGSTGAGDFNLTAGIAFGEEFPAVNLTAATGSGALDLHMASYYWQADILATSTTGNIGIDIGDGNDHIAATSANGTITINAGQGADTITATGSGTGSSIAITAGGNDHITAMAMGNVAIASSAYHGLTLSATSVNDDVTMVFTGPTESGNFDLHADAAHGSISIDASSGIDAGSEVFNLDLGAHVSASISTSGVGSGGLNAINTMIAGLQRGDTLHIVDTAADSTSALGNFGSIADGLSAAHGNATGGGVLAFTSGGNTYLVEDAAAGVSGTVIELLGNHTILSVAGGVITMAS